MLWTGHDGTTPSMPKTENIEKHSQRTRYEVITFFFNFAFLMMNAFFTSMTLIIVCLIKVRIQIRRVSTFGPRPENTSLQGFANNKGADQPSHIRSLISAFVIRRLESII